MRRAPFDHGRQTRPHANFFAEMHGVLRPTGAGTITVRAASDGSEAVAVRTEAR